LPLKFIVDTGVRTTILTEKIYSDILHLAYSKKFTITAPGGENSVTAYIANNVTIDMPGVHGRGHAMLYWKTIFWNYETLWAQKFMEFWGMTF